MIRVEARVVLFLITATMAGWALNCVLNSNFRPATAHTTPGKRQQNHLATATKQFSPV